MKKIECIIVSVGYDDFLSHSLPLNKSFFDRMLVVTSTKDIGTRKVCEFHHVECLQTDAMYDDGAPFNKGKAINEGLKQLNFSDWVIHLDADIVLPAKTRVLLEQIDMNDQFLYGVDRLMCPTYEDWVRFIGNPSSQHELAYVHVVSPFPVGTRLVKFEDNIGGYIPLGFFQMWNRRCTSLKNPVYPEDWDNAGGSDCTFAYRWPRAKRHLLPELLAIHLDSDKGGLGRMGDNWKGRVTPRFGPRDPFNLVRPRPIVEEAKQ